MDPMMKKMIGELPKSKDDQLSKDAKASALLKLKKDVMGAEAGKMFASESPKQVTVAADSEEGLEEGLDAAKEVIGDSNLDEESEEESVDLMEQADKLDMEEVEALMAKLQERKSELEKEME